MRWYKGKKCRSNSNEWSNRYKWTNFNNFPHLITTLMGRWWILKCYTNYNRWITKVRKVTKYQIRIKAKWRWTKWKWCRWWWWCPCLCKFSKWSTIRCRLIRCTTIWICTIQEWIIITAAIISPPQTTKVKDIRTSIIIINIGITLDTTIKNMVVEVSKDRVSIIIFSTIITKTNRGEII